MLADVGESTNGEYFCQYKYNRLATSLQVLCSSKSWLGWGAHLLGQLVAGLWSEEEKQEYINILKLKVVYMLSKLSRIV